MLLLKLLFVPLLIAAITLAGEKLGPRIAGLLSGIPVISGPIAFFLALEYGPEFAAKAAQGTLAGEFSLATFCVLYAAICPRAPWWAAAALGWLGFAGATWLLQTLRLSLLMSFAVALLSPVLVIALTRSPTLPPGLRTTGKFDIAGRMLAGAALVLFLTSVAQWLGPRLSGLLTIFPIITSVLAIASHRTSGPEFAVQLLRGLGMGLQSVTAFFTVLALSLDRLGVAAGFSVAVAAALGTQLLALRWLRTQKNPVRG